MTGLRALIVDDEPPARKALRSMLERESDVELVGECENGIQALDAIRARTPDLVFLDIEMPGLNGFELLEQLPAECSPIVVFVTAFSDYAVEAFRVRAVDYLLKPFDGERLRETLDRVRDRASRPSTTEDWRGLIDELSARSRPDRLAVLDGDATVVVRTATVRWFEAEGNYVRLHLGEKSFLARSSLRSMERRLDPSRFARIHRGTIVNVDLVRRLRAIGHGDYRLTLSDGTELTLSRRYRERFEELIERLV